jgi:hypothetical protein
MIILPVLAARKIQFLGLWCRCGKAGQLYPYASWFSAVYAIASRTG